MIDIKFSDGHLVTPVEIGSGENGGCLIFLPEGTIDHRNFPAKALIDLMITAEDAGKKRIDAADLTRLETDHSNYLKSLPKPPKTGFHWNELLTRSL